MKSFLICFHYTLLQTQFVILTYANSIFAAMFLHLFFEAPFAKVSQLLFATYDSGCQRRRRRQLKSGKKTTKDEEELKKINIINGKGGGGESEKALEVLSLAKFVSTNTTTSAAESALSTIAQ